MSSHHIPPSSTDTNETQNIIRVPGSKDLVDHPIEFKKNHRKSPSLISISHSTGTIPKKQTNGLRNTIGTVVLSIRENGAVSITLEQRTVSLSLINSTSKDSIKPTIYP